MCAGMSIRNCAGTSHADIVMHVSMPTLSGTSHAYIVMHVGMHA